MSKERYHDVVNSDVEGIAFLAANSIIDYSFLWWHKYAIVSEVAYWWKEFDRCCVDRYMLFTDNEQCAKFCRYSADFGIDHESCLVVPPSLYDHFIHTRHAKIIYSVWEVEEELSVMQAHFSKPEST